MGTDNSVAEQGHAHHPAPWDVARELRYWSDFEDELDAPLPRGFTIYRNSDRPNSPLDYPRFGLGGRGWVGQSKTLNPINTS